MEHSEGGAISNRRRADAEEGTQPDVYDGGDRDGGGAGDGDGDGDDSGKERASPSQMTGTPSHVYTTYVT